MGGFFKVCTWCGGLTLKSVQFFWLDVLPVFWAKSRVRAGYGMFMGRAAVLSIRAGEKIAKNFICGFCAPFGAVRMLGGKAADLSRIQAVRATASSRIGKWIRAAATPSTTAVHHITA